MDHKIIYTDGYAAFISSFLAVIAAPNYHDVYHDLEEDCSDETIAYLSSLSDTAETRSDLINSRRIIVDASATNYPGAVVLECLNVAADKVSKALSWWSSEPTNSPVITILRKYDGTVGVEDKILPPVSALLRIELRRAQTRLLQKEPTF